MKKEEYKNENWAVTFQNCVTLYLHKTQDHILLQQLDSASSLCTGSRQTQTQTHTDTHTHTHTHRKRERE